MLTLGLLVGAFVPAGADAACVELLDAELADTETSTTSSASTTNAIETPSSCGVRQSSGGTSGPTLSRANNTAILDRDANPLPVVAGQHLVGPLGHLHFHNLSDLVAYTLIAAGGTKIGTLTSEAGSIQYFRIDLRAEGVWRLYRDADLSALGTAATPIVEFTVVAGDTLLPVGSFLQVLPGTLPVLDAEVHVCTASATGTGAVGPDATPPGARMVTVPPGGGFVAMTMSWNTTLGTGESAQFVVMGKPYLRTAPLAAASNLSVKTEVGYTTIVEFVTPGTDYVMECGVRAGHISRGLRTIEVPVTIRSG